MKSTASMVANFSQVLHLRLKKENDAAKQCNAKIRSGKVSPLEINIVKKELQNHIASASIIQGHQMTCEHKEVSRYGKVICCKGCGVSYEGKE